MTATSSTLPVIFIATSQYTTGASFQRRVTVAEALPNAVPRIAIVRLVVETSCPGRLLADSVKKISTLSGLQKNLSIGQEGVRCIMGQLTHCVNCLAFVRSKRLTDPRTVGRVKPDRSFAYVFSDRIFCLFSFDHRYATNIVWVIGCQ